jgi:acyl carrier protein
MEVSISGRNELLREVAELIIETVGLDYIDKNQITEETSLVEDPFQMDSIDILEAIVAVENRYKIKIANAEDGAKYFRSFGSIVDFIQKR